MTASFEKINSSHQKISTENSRFKTAVVKEPLSKLGIQVVGSEKLTFRKISIGNNLAIYTISAEPVSYYTKIIEDNTKEKYLLYSGYVDHVFGYLPSWQQVLEGGYESIGYFDTFLVKGAFLKTIELSIISSLRKLNK